MSARKTLFILCCGLIAASPFLLAQEEIKTGVILDKVVCSQSPDQSYALYLPSNYASDRIWPILYALDPGARGRVAVERFAPAAEKWQVIVAGSNNVRNGPWEDIITAVLALREDIRHRFPTDPKQTYVTGFSGGSRAASMFMKITGEPVAAIIACGAGLATHLSPPDIAPAYYYGLVGNEDFNYQEMRGLEEQLADSGLPHRLLVFDGPHNWPSEEICGRALGWVVYRSMAQGSRPKEEKTFQEVFQAELEAARALEASGRILQAVKDFEALLAEFPEPSKPLGLQALVDRWKQSPDWAKALKKERSLRQEENHAVDDRRRFLASIERNPPDPMDFSRMLFELGLDGLAKRAQKSDRPEDKALARRLLAGLEIDAREKGFESYEKRDTGRAVLFFEVAARAGDPLLARRWVNFYYLACAHARAGHVGEALANIRKAVANGLTDPGLLEKEEDFQPFRQHPDFQQILKSLREKK